jgi:hypothetical protein
MAVSVAVNGGGDAVVYQTSAGVYFDLLDSALTPVQLDQAVSSSPSSWIDATTRDGGGFTVEWLSNGSILAEDFSASGASLDTPHAWTGAAPTPAPLAFASGADGASTVLPTGGSVTGSVQTVGNQYQLIIQQHDANGNPDAPAFTLTAQPVTMFGAPNLAPLADGSYVAAYAVDGNYSASLYLERFSSTGTPLGQIAVAHYGGLVSLQPSDYAIAGLADGGFVAAWSVANGTPGASSTPEAYAEEFTAAGVGLGVVDLGHASSQAPVIDALSDGHYVVSWTSDTGAAEHQAFSEAGASLGAQAPAAPAGSDPAGGQTASQTGTAGTTATPETAPTTSGTAASAEAPATASATSSATTSASHVQTSTAASAGSAPHGFGAMLSGLASRHADPSVTSHESSSTSVATDPSLSALHDPLQLAFGMHAGHMASSFL